jgi:hypothetical protein
VVFKEFIHWSQEVPLTQSRHPTKQGIQSSELTSKKLYLQKHSFVRFLVEIPIHAVHYLVSCMQERHFLSQGEHNLVLSIKYPT